MKASWFFSAAALAAFGMWVPAAAQVSIPAAVAAQTRGADNVKLDAGRKPAELLRFLGLRPGMEVYDMFGGNRYWAEIMAPVVGPNGRVWVWQPRQFYSDKTRAAFVELAAQYPQVGLVTSPFEAPELRENFADLMLINLDYHDVYWENAQRKILRMEPDAFTRALFAAVKPGGVVGVIDHSAKAGSDPRETVEKLHRIDPAIVRADFERAGFRLEAESKLLRNPADDLTLLVFDSAIRGKTDRFIYKFRKPR